jgi:transformation/transcription domain-associated protein
MQTDTSYIALSDIYDEHCENMGITREDPILVAGEKIKQVVRDFRKSNGKMVSPLSLF